MRSVEVVKEKRNELRNELTKFTNALNDRRVDGALRPSGEFQKKELAYIFDTIKALQSQINVIGYVLNEDTELQDATKPNTAFEEIGITREEILGERQ